MKTKLFTLLFALLLANGLFAERTKIGNLYYNLDEDTRTAEVTFETYHYEGDNYASLSGAVVIPSSVTYNNIQYSVTSIEDGAFYRCTGLTSITIPESVTIIHSNEYGAIYYCENLRSLEILNPSVGGEFSTFLLGCYNLASLTVPASIINALGQPWSLLDSPNRLVTLKVTGGEIDAFGLAFVQRSRQTLQTVDMGAVSNTELADQALQGCYQLKNLVWPASIERIGYMALAECVSLDAINIPASVTEIDDRAFENCRGLNKVTFGNASASASAWQAPAAGSRLTRIGNWAFYNCHQVENLIVPEGVTEIGTGAFYGCTYLENAVLPASVQSIGDNGFALCSRLSRIHVRAAVPPQIEAKTFCDVNRSIPVYVPDAALAAYQTDPYWSEFNLVAESASAVENVTLQGMRVEAGMLVFGEPAEVSVYTVAGVCVHSGMTERLQLPSGVYTVRCGNAACKTLIP
ncbi:MAG: leucine-rich repeat domain-containing protein [Paludibacteraceae bacterium]